ncbi:MAG: Mur ligase family protein [Bdellovibrionota bacterium]
MKSVLLPYFNKVRGNIIPGAHRIQKLVSPWLSAGILNFPCILVTGSNGKGSTCAYLERILREHGIKTGLYTSPHLVHPNERIRINGVPVLEEVLAENIIEIEKQISLYLPDASFFEITTATALLIFLKEKINFLVCEVGLGGHFDSTNALSPLLSVLTSISLEHTEYLGNSIQKIAADKAYVSRRNRPFIVASLSDEAFAGVKDSCEKIGSRIVLSEKGDNVNLQTALCAIQQLSTVTDLKFDKDVIQSAVKKTFWPGRFDVREIRNRTVIFDASHNPDGFNFFAQKYLTSSFAGKKCVLIFASLSDKDWESTLKKIHLIAEHVIFTQIESSRSVPVEKFLNSVAQMQSFPDYEIISNIDEALEKALNTKPQLTLVLTGSIAFIGTAMEHFGLEVFVN